MFDSNKSRGRVLVIDDSKLVRQKVRAALEPVGYDVLELESAVDAVRVILRKVPDVVLMDIAMPQLSGDEATSIIKASNVGHKTLVLLFSERPEEELQRLAESCAADGYIRKTPSEAELVIRLDAWFERLRESEAS